MRLALIAIVLILCLIELMEIDHDVRHVCGTNQTCRVEMEAPQ